MSCTIEKFMNKVKKLDGNVEFELSTKKRMEPLIKASIEYNKDVEVQDYSSAEVIKAVKEKDDSKISTDEDVKSADNTEAKSRTTSEGNNNSGSNRGKVGNIDKEYTRKEIENDKKINPKYIYLFGENSNGTSGNNPIAGSNKKYPNSTQAVIRGLSNAFGITTAKNGIGLKYTDKDINILKAEWDKEFKKLEDKINAGYNIIYPVNKDGEITLGIGKSGFDNSPKLKAELKDRIAKLKEYADGNSSGSEQKGTTDEKQSDEIYSGDIPSYDEKNTKKELLNKNKELNANEEQEEYDKAEKAFKESPELKKLQDEFLGSKVRMTTVIKDEQSRIETAVGLKSIKEFDKYGNPINGKNKNKRMHGADSARAYWKEYGKIHNKYFKKYDKKYQNEIPLNKNNEKTPLEKAYATDIELGEIKIDTMEDLIEFSSKYNESIDGTTEYSSGSIAKATEWYSKILSDMVKNGFKFQPITIKIVNKIVDENGEYNGALGMAFQQKDLDGRKTIVLVKDGIHRQMPALTVVHEYVHTITAAALESDQKAKARIRSIMDKAKAQLSIDGKLPADVEYAFTNETEFVAEVMANPRLQNKLNKIDSSKNGVVNKIRKIFNAIMKRFKGDKNTLLTESLNEIYELQLKNNGSQVSAKTNANVNTELLLGDENRTKMRELEMERIGDAIDASKKAESEIWDWLNDHARIKYSGSRSGKKMEIKLVEVNENTLDTKIVFNDNKQYTFAQGQQISKTTKSGNNVTIEGLELFTNKLKRPQDIINANLDTIADEILEKTLECE